MDEACAVSARTGVEIPEMQPIPGGDGAPKAGGRTGFAGLFGDYLLPTLVLGLMSATGLVLVYSLNTWLPELMLRAGFNAKGSLSFLVVLNGGAVLGALGAARVADWFGPKPASAGSPASGSRPPSWNQRSTSWSAGVLPRDSRCSGPSRAPTCFYRPEPKPSTARCATCSPLGIRPWLPTTTTVRFPPLRPDQLPCFDMLPKVVVSLKLSVRSWKGMKE
jgi:hypothetical protein